MDKKEGILKAEKYCAYQERCQKELRNKLYEWGLYRDDVENIISEMVVKGFLNEERFAIQYTLGKFRMKKWGRVKIQSELEFREISKYCLKKAFKELEKEDYLSTLESELKKKWANVKENNDFLKKDKVGKYLMSRGFEGDLVWDLLKSKK